MNFLRREAMFSGAGSPLPVSPVETDLEIPRGVEFGLTGSGPRRRMPADTVRPVETLQAGG